MKVWPMRCFLTLSFLLMFLPLPSSVSVADVLPDVKTVETYLDSLSTLKARFVQTSYDGKRAVGTFMLKRPGRLRFEYDPPVTDFIVADGTLIYYYDGQMKQQSSTPISASLADFFLRPDMKLSGDISVSNIKRAGGLLRVTFLQSRDPQAGSLTIMLGEKPLQLKKWSIVDSQGLTTVVELYDMQQGIPLKSGLFYYYDPENKKPFINK